jgi:DNA-binding transcriptional ArsR family regulator
VKDQTLKNDTVLARIKALEARVEALETAPKLKPKPEASRDQFWALDRIAQDHPEGALVFAGQVNLPNGGQYVWQESELTDAQLQANWDDAAPILAALGHPTRLALLRAVLHGSHSTADLQANPEFAAAGKLYHHLRELQAAGWLALEGRGRYVIPAQRVIPLLILVRATGSIDTSAQKPA